MKPRIRWVLGLAFATGCVSGPEAIPPPPTPALAGYRAFALETVDVQYEPLSARPTAPQQRRMVERFRRDLASSISSQLGLTPAEAGSSHAVHVRVVVDGVRLPHPGRAASGRTTAYVSPGQPLPCHVELVDPASGAPLLRFQVQRPLPGGTFTAPDWIELERMRILLRAFAWEVAAAMDEARGTG
jgi:hypothetical protein